MRRQSKKTAARENIVRPILDGLKLELGSCEICGSSKRRLEAHEIARGSHRSKARGKLFASLIVCITCHRELDDTRAWPHARQLGVLKRSRPKDFDLAAFNALVGSGPNRITEAEVAEMMIESLFTRPIGDGNPFSNLG